MKYIDKDVLVAEIERLQDAMRATAIDGRISREQAEAYKVCVKLRSFVEDALEVKETDYNDAFIEKAISYLNSKLYDWVQITNPNQRSYANTIMKQDFIKDFRNYIKGE